MEGIKAKMVFYKAEDKNSRCKSQGKTQDIDQGIDLSAFQITQNDFEVISQHDPISPRMLPSIQNIIYGPPAHFCFLLSVRI
ncbi:MAG TPA: hypothetical protein VIM87_01350 [Chitinophaga sp.]